MESAAAAMKISEEEVMARTLAKDPIAVGRIGTVEEVATAIVFMAFAARRVDHRNVVGRRRWDNSAASDRS